jgi:hypothetical protein
MQVKGAAINAGGKCAKWEDGRREGLGPDSETDVRPHSP